MSIIWRPYAVTLDEIGMHGSCPTVAPVKPYTELADTFSASWRPFITARTNGSFAAFMSFLARLRASSSYLRIVGRLPLCLLARTNTCPLGVRSYSSGASLPTSWRATSVV